MVTRLLLVLALTLVLIASPAESYSSSPRSRVDVRTAKVSTTQLNKWRRTKATWKTGPGQTPSAPSTLDHLVGVAPPESQAAPVAEASAFEASAALQYGGMPSANGAIKPGGYGFGSGAAKWKTATPAATAGASFMGVQPTQAKVAYARGKYGFSAGAAKWKSGASGGGAPGGFTPAAPAAPADVAPAAPAAAAPSKGWGIGSGAAKWKS